MAAAAGGSRVMGWRHQHHAVASSSGSQGVGVGVGVVVRRSGHDRVLQQQQLLLRAAAPSSQFLVSGGMRGSLVLCSGQFQVRAIRSSAPVVEDTTVVHSRSFEGIQTEHELMQAIAKEVEKGRLSDRVGEGMEELYRNYRDAVVGGGAEDAMDVVIRVMAAVLDRILVQFEEPFTFESYHPRMTDPYDYYTFGQNYVRPLIDYRNSYLGNLEIFDKIEKNLKEGHNVILLSNHQTEADPAVMALLLEHTHPYLAENLTYVAGDRVVLDPFCKPFSMGRNLLCVYSKKHINDVPDLVDMKRKANARTLMQMTTLLRKGGRLLWVAPSGGRDRPDSETNEWIPASFDSSAVESMKRLSEAVRVPAHIHPLSLLCFEIMPPPTKVEKELGERRAVGFSGVGLAVSEELDCELITESNPDNAREAIAAEAWTEVNDMYNGLKAAIYGGKGCGSSSSSLRLEQPWLDENRLRV